MTVGNKSGKAKSEGPFYVRLKNLPPGACQKQVRDFLQDLPVPEGGVSIHRSCAFVVFDSQTDAQLAVSMDQRILEGKVVRVSNANHKDVRRTQLLDVRRQLPECWTVEKRKKRIRPTTVKECAGEGASKKFCPDEIDFPGNISESFLVDGKAYGKKNESGLIDGKVQGKKNESCLLDGKVQGKKNKSCLLDGKVQGKKNESCLLDVKVPVKQGESCLLDEKVPEKNETCLPDDNVIGKRNEYCLLGGNVSEKIESCLLDEKFAIKKSRLLDGNALDKNKSCLFVGKVPGNINDSNVQVQKKTEPLKRIPIKKTIKPTPVFTLSQFKLVYEGTVF